MRQANKKRKELWVLALISLLASFLATRVLDTAKPRSGTSGMLTPQSINQYFEGRSLAKIEEYIGEKRALEEKRDSLLEQTWALEGIIEIYEQRAAEGIEKGEQIRRELHESRIMAGMLDLEGPGIEIILDDRKRDTIMDHDPGMLGFYIVHDSDLLEVINELRAAGAEAISINGVRITGSSRISCGGPTINVGIEQRFAPPFVINALGDPEALAGYFHREDSIYNTLQFWGLRFDITKKDMVDVPRFIG
ncbi:MAG: DUF881 domain-containing protein, partial [Clostridiales bacterium]|nr:DUF881 domain-containing protein [Clostridiales bacterium]